MEKVCNLAKLEINRIQRSFISRSPNFLKDAHKTYVRPIIEYNNEVWNPVYIVEEFSLEAGMHTCSRPGSELIR